MCVYECECVCVRGPRVLSAETTDDVPKDDAFVPWKDAIDLSLEKGHEGGGDDDVSPPQSDTRVT